MTKKPVSTKVVTTGVSAMRSSTAATSERIRDATVRASTGSPRMKPSSSVARRTSSIEALGWT